MSNYTLTLPFPVTTNSLYRNVPGRGRVKTERHRTWRQAAGWDLEQQKPPRVEGPISLEIAVCRPDRRKRDISNLIKCVEDLLVDHGVIEDDSLVHDLRIHWQPGIEGARVTIERKDAA